MSLKPNYNMERDIALRGREEPTTSIGPHLKGTQIRQVVTVIAEAITQNNARILEAFTESGIKLKLD